MKNQDKLKVSQWCEDQKYIMEPDCYGGEECDKLKPRWATSYPKEGKVYEGDLLDFKFEASYFPPGSRITIEIPFCPNCGDRADQNGYGESHKEWPDCLCGFSWTKWAFDNFS